jgi:hypothetical protein
LSGDGVAAAYELLCTVRGRFVMSGIEMHAVVALIEELPEEGLVRGQVGTVVESWLRVSTRSSSATAMAGPVP